ncbi:MAG: N-6 DNA methylase [Parvibaculales bacterium]
MYENTFKTLDNILRQESRMSTEPDYVEQASWVLFLKYLADYEIERCDRAELSGKTYEPILKSSFRWREWAYPIGANGKLDDNAIRIGDDLIEFVNNELFPYLRKLREDADSSDSIEYKIGEIFSEIDNRYMSGYSLREVIDQVAGLNFNKSDTVHELSILYEQRIKKMGNAGRTGGQYYTPRPLIRAMIKVIDPKIGETIYDGAAGSAGFLCEAYDYLNTGRLSARSLETLQKHTLYGQEKKGLSFIIGNMNMILHGIETPNLIYINTLKQDVMDIENKDRHDIILANPPFGGSGEEKSVQLNFPIRTSEPAYMFLQHFIRKMKAGGRAAIVIKNTFLSNGDASTLRKELLTTCNLHTVLDLPAKVFQAGVRTVVLFFEKGKATKDIWYYQLDPGRSLGKTNPLNDDDLGEFIALQKSRAEGEKSWVVSVDGLHEETYDLSVKNPNAPQEAPLRSPKEIIDDIGARNSETAKALKEIKGIL